MDCKKKRHLIHHRIKLAGRNSLRRSFRKLMSSKRTKARRSASSFWNAGLRANNRSLAQALQELRIQFGFAHQQNLKYQHEIQFLHQKISELGQNNDVERKIEKYKNVFIQMEGGLNNVGDKLIEAVDILSNLVQSSHEVLESIDNRASASQNCWTGGSFEMTALQQNDKPRLLTDAVKASVLNMSVIMEQSAIVEEEESSEEEIVEQQKDPLSTKKQHKYSCIPPNLSPQLEPSPLTSRKTFLETKEENLDSELGTSENFELASKPSPANQSENLKLITPKVKTIIDLSMTPPSPVLSVNFDAELKKLNSKYNATEVKCFTPPSGKSSTSRRGTYRVKKNHLKESKLTLSYPISPDTKKTSNQIELFPQGISFVAQRKFPSRTAVDDDSFHHNASSANNSPLPTDKRISKSADEIEQNSKSCLDLGESVVDEKNGVYSINGFSRVQQRRHSKPSSFCNQSENNSCFLNDVEILSVEFNKLYNKGSDESLNGQTCRGRSYLCSIKEDSILDPKEWELSNKKRPIRDVGKPKRVKKIKKQKHQKEMNNETDFVSNASEKINKENVNFEGIVTPKHTHQGIIDKKARNLSMEEKLYSSNPEGYERIRKALTPSNKKRKKKNNSSKTLLLEKETSLPFADSSFPKIDADTCFMNNIETDLKEQESSLSNFERNSSVSSKEAQKPSLSNPSTPAVLECNSFDNSSIDGSERRPRRARAQVYSYKQLPLNAKLRRT